MRFLFPALAAAVIVAAAAMPDTAAAAMINPHPRVQPLDCTATAAKIGRAKTWQTFFKGWHRGDFSDEPPYFYQAWPCFTSKANCVNWLYWAQSDYPDQTLVYQCKQGIPY